MFCVECGREGPTTDGLCASCFAKKSPLVEPVRHIDVGRCTQCGSLHGVAGWTRVPLEEALPGLIHDRVPVRAPFPDAVFEAHLDAEDPNNYRLDVTATGTYKGLEQRQRFRSRLRLKPTLCDTCAKQRSQYFEGTLQVRADGRELTGPEIRAARTFVQVRVDRLHDSGDFVSKIELVRGGLDFYLSTNALAKSLARELAQTLGGTASSSPKLYGRRDGRDLYRVTSLVRLGAFRPGDVVRFQRGLHEVLAIGPLATLRDLVSGELRRYKPRDLRSARRVDAERFVTTLTRAESDEVLAEHQESGTQRRVATRGAKPGRAQIVWADGSAFVSTLSSDGPKD